MNAFENEVRDDTGRTVGTFTSHWAAMRALSRLRGVQFAPGLDLPRDLAVEQDMRERLAL